MILHRKSMSAIKGMAVKASRTVQDEQKVRKYNENHLHDEDANDLWLYFQSGSTCPFVRSLCAFTEWSKGGHTTDNNMQMLYKKCNAAKSNK